MEAPELEVMERILAGEAPWQDLAVCGLRSTVQSVIKNHEQPKPEANPEHLIDPETFYPASSRSSTKYEVEVEVARAICSTCPVADFCLRTALQNGHKEGVWGGMSEDERKEAKRKIPKQILPVLDLATVNRLRASYAKPLDSYQVAALREKIRLSYRPSKAKTAKGSVALPGKAHSETA